MCKIENLNNFSKYEREKMNVNAIKIQPLISLFIEKKYSENNIFLSISLSFV